MGNPSQSTIELRRMALQLLEENDRQPQRALDGLMHYIRTSESMAIFKALMSYDELEQDALKYLEDAACSLNKDASLRMR
jgi:hypothetical protein